MKSLPAFLIFVIYLIFIPSGKSQGSFCIWGCGSNYNTTSTSGCFTLDINDLDGFFVLGSTYNPVLGPGLAPIQLVPPQYSCSPASASNPIYYFFVAGSTYISMGADLSNCFAGGVQFGLSPDCDSDCLVSDLSLNTSSVSIEYDELIPGNTYMIWFDGYVGSYCDLDIWVDGNTPVFEYDEPYSITARSNCSDVCFTQNCDGAINCSVEEEITVCPGDEIEFDLRHQGDSPVENGDYNDACSFYNPGLNSIFEWTFNGQTFDFIPSEDGSIGPTITMPQVSVVTEMELCHTGITNGYMQSNEEICINIIIQPIEHEDYTYTLCAEDLENSWEVPAEDPNGDGIEWQGPESFTLDEVRNWSNGCYQSTEYINCNCEVSQTICIEVIGSVEPVAETLYMFECQFDDGDYDWTWDNPSEILTLSNLESGGLFTLEDHSLIGDYLSESCDTVMSISVETIDLQGVITQLDCNTTEGTTYEFSLDLSYIDNVPEYTWTEIDDDYFYQWINCETGEVIKNNEPLFISSSQEVCVRANYSFYDGAYGHPDLSHRTKYVSCDKKFGPFTLENTCGSSSDIATCPNWNNGITVFVDGLQLVPTESEIALGQGRELTLIVDENSLPDNSTIEWWLMDNVTDLPGQSGILVGTSQIESNWTYGKQYPELLAISYKDFEDASEYFIVGTGSGLYINDLFIELDPNCDETCPQDCFTELYGSQCEWTSSDKEVLKDCANIIPVGPGDFVPPNSILVVYVDENEEQLIRSAENLCSLDGCIYVLFSKCERCLDAFTDEGPGSYTLFGDGYNSTLDYVGQPDGGAVNNKGVYSFERDSLPQVEAMPHIISAEVSPSTFSVSCPGYEGTKFIQGVIVSDTYNDGCCSPYTPQLRVTLSCNPIDPELFWTNISQLPTDIDIDNGTCDSPAIVEDFFPNSPYSFPLGLDAYFSNCPGGSTFSSSHQQLQIFQEGSTTVVFTVSDSCGNIITHDFDVTVFCDDITGGSDDQVFTDFPFLSNLVNQQDCENTTISVYESGIYSFIHIESDMGGQLYFETGLLYCTDSGSFSCVDAYNLGVPNTVWECAGSGGGNGANGPDVFMDYPWISNHIDANDCDGVEVELYQFGSNLFPYIVSDDSAVLYSNTGQLYCTSVLPSFDCISVYGLSAPVSVWSCNGAVHTVDPIFDAYPWLSDHIDPSDCSGTKVTVYQSGTYLYLIVENSESTTMYNESGLFYCQDFGNFSCADAYGFSDADIVEVWDCNSFIELEEREERKEESIEVLLFPNPTSGKVRIQSNLPIEELEILIYDSYGRKVMKPLVSDAKVIDLEYLQSGLYLVAIHYENKVRIEKVIKI